MIRPTRTRMDVPPRTAAVVWLVSVALVLAVVAATTGGVPW